MTNIRPFGNRSEFTNRSMDQFYNLVDNFFNNNFTPARALMTGTFKVDIEELPDKFVVEAELPGYSKEEIQISLNEGQLKITAQKEENVDESDNERNFIHRERRLSSVSRSMYFDNIDTEGLKASLENGVLAIDIPKKSKTENIKTITIE